VGGENQEESPAHHLQGLTRQNARVINPHQKMQNGTAHVTQNAVEMTSAPYVAMTLKRVNANWIMIGVIPARAAH